MCTCNYGEFIVHYKDNKYYLLLSSIVTLKRHHIKNNILYIYIKIFNMENKIMGKVI